MGYTTDFFGKFKLDKPLDDDTYELLIGINETRRMKRKVAAKYGVEGEFYIKGKGSYGQNSDKTVLDNNNPPSTQPGLWCQWRPTEDRKSIEWDGGEKFYEYTAWIEYLIEKILKPRGYVLNGGVQWSGEDTNDSGTISVVNNITSAVELHEYKYILDEILKQKVLLPTLMGIHKSLDEMIHAAQQEPG